MGILLRSESVSGLPGRKSTQNGNVCGCGTSMPWLSVKSVDALVLPGSFAPVKHFLCKSSNICERDQPFAHVETAMGKVSKELFLMYVLCPHRITGQS